MMSVTLWFSCPRVWETGVRDLSGGFRIGFAYFIYWVLYILLKVRLEFRENAVRVSLELIEGIHRKACIIMARNRIGAKALAASTVLASAFIGVSAQAAQGTDCTDEHVVSVVRLTNEERTSRGLTEVHCDDHLVKGSQEWADHMRKTGEFEHYDGGNFSENIAWRSNKATPNQMVKDWMDSSGHRANILDSDVSIMGVGWSYSEKNGTYAVQRFW